MRQLVCPNCGAGDFVYKDGIRICKYCNSRYELTEEERPKKATRVSLQSDIDLLLEKCKTDPTHARKYAELVLDIDPTNNVAWQYLR